MILKILTAALLFLAIQSVQGEEPKQEAKAQLFQIHFDIKSDSLPYQRLFLVDGELLLFTRFSDVPEPDAKRFEGGGSDADFEIRDTPKGQLLVVPSIVIHRPQGKNNLEGYYVTADYSNMPPTIKFTKEPEKYSYWKIPMDNFGPIVNLSDFKKPAYLSVGSQIIKLNHPNDNGHREFLKVNLSLEPKDQFKVEKIPPPK